MAENKKQGNGLGRATAVVGGTAAGAGAFKVGTDMLSKGTKDIAEKVGEGLPKPNFSMNTFFQDGNGEVIGQVINDPARQLAGRAVDIPETTNIIDKVTGEITGQLKVDANAVEQLKPSAETLKENAAKYFKGDFLDVAANAKPQELEQVSQAAIDGFNQSSSTYSVAGEALAGAKDNVFETVKGAAEKGKEAVEQNSEKAAGLFGKIKDGVAGTVDKFQDLDGKGKAIVIGSSVAATVITALVLDKIFNPKPKIDTNDMEHQGQLQGREAAMSPA